MRRWRRREEDGGEEDGEGFGADRRQKKRGGATVGPAKRTDAKSFNSYTTGRSDGVSC